MPTFKFKLHDYANPSNPDDCICIGGPLLNSEFVNSMLGSAGGSDVEFDISSVGGDLKAGLDMFDAIKSYGKADTRIGAMAASSAGIVAMAGRSVKMSKYGLLMLHKPMTGSGGNANDLIADVQMLNIMQSRIAQIYADKSGLDLVTINSLIDAVTWLTADQALDLGFIDEIEEDRAVDIANHAIVSLHARTAPIVYQRVFNKLSTIQNDKMKTEDKEIIEKNTGLMAKVTNMFKAMFGFKTVTNKGTLNSSGPIAKGSAVTNDAGEPAEDGDYPIENNGKTITATVLNGVVTNMDGEEDEDDNEDVTNTAEETEEVENNIVLNSVGLKVTNKSDAAGIAKVVTNLQKLNNDSAVIITELRAQLKVSNEAVDRDEAAIRSTIESEFTPNGSRRSETGVKDAVINIVTNSHAGIMPKDGSAAANALKRTMANAKNK